MKKDKMPRTQDTLNSEVKRITEHYRHSYIGDIEEMRNDMLSMGESDEAKEKTIKTSNTICSQ